MFRIVRILTRILFIFVALSRDIKSVSCLLNVNTSKFIVNKCTYAYNMIAKSILVMLRNEISSLNYEIVIPTFGFAIP